MVKSSNIVRGLGEMAGLMRATDWSATPLGPIESWPVSLKTAVGVMLESPFPMNIWWGPDLLCLYNDGYRPILGDKHPRALGSPGREVWSDIWPIVGPLADGVARGGPAVFHEHLHLPMQRRGFLEETYFTFSYSAIPNDDGGIGGVLITCQETTVQIQDERQLRTLRDLAQRAAGASDARDASMRAASALAENASDVPFSAIYLFEAEGIRRRGQSGLGLDADRLPGEAELLEAATACLARARETNEPDRCIEIPAAVPVASDGERPRTAVVLPLVRTGQQPFGMVVLGVSPMRLLDERYLGFFALCADQIANGIANAVAFAEEARRAEALAEIDRAKTTFFSNISHEFRTPLTLMLGPTEEALGSPARSLEGEALEAVHRNQLRLLKLVNSLLEVSRIEAGRMELSLEPIDLGVRTAEIASAFRSAMQQAGLEYQVESPPLGYPVLVDPGIWERIVLNLISNAIKYTIEGSVRVCLAVNEEAIVLRVSDSGIGIPEESRALIFERFHRVPGVRARTEEGSGIGLALVREFARLHGGVVDLESEVGRGSTFEVRIPARRAEGMGEAWREVTSGRSAMIGAYVDEVKRWHPSSGNAPSTPGLEESEATEPATVRTKPRLLVVDDNADMRSYLTRLLGERFDVVTAGNGVEALTLARSSPPALIVSDAMMPELDGFGLLREVRSDAMLARVPFLMLSARAGEESRVDGLERGVDDYIVKPFSGRELIARVHTHLQLAQLRNEATAASERLHELFSQSPIAIAVFRGPEHRFELANPAYLAMVGRQDVLGKPVFDVFPEMRSTPVAPLFESVYQTGEPFTTDDYVLPIEREGAIEEATFQFNLVPIREDGEVRGLMCTAVEITEQVRAREAAEEL